MRIPEGATDPKTRKRLRRPDMVAQQIREQIVEAGLRPGDRVPADWLLPETVKVSRGSLREALKVLEFQGLIGWVSLGKAQVDLGGLGEIVGRNDGSAGRALGRRVVQRFKRSL